MAGRVLRLSVPALCEVAPAAFELAYLADVAGGLVAAASLLGTTPTALAGLMTGGSVVVTGLSVWLVWLSTCELSGLLAGQAGWSYVPGFSLRDAA